MSLKHAMAFIQRVYDDPILHKEIAGLGDPKELDDITALGARFGYYFTAKELARAFPIDWEMRWRHFTSKIEKKNASSSGGVSA